ncbi:hypothetical protein BJX70DRAFT_393266 [Aspergillus crustosus]
MTDLTPTFADLVHEHDGSLSLYSRPLSIETADEFLKEAYRINTHISSLLAHLYKIRPSFLSIASTTQSTGKPGKPGKHRTTPSTSTTSREKDKQPLLSPTELDNITTSTSTLLHTLSTSISNLSSAETLRHETHSTLLDKKYGRKRSKASNLLFQWAAGSALSDDQNASDAGKKAEQITDEQTEDLLRSVREGVLWFLRRRLEGTIELQRGMVEKRIERAKEREKSVFYKVATATATATAASPSSSGPSSARPFDREDVAISAPSTYPDSALELTETQTKGFSTLDTAEVAAIEAELTPQQLQLFAEENDSMVKYYEETLSKVQYVSPRSILVPFPSPAQTNYQNHETKLTLGKKKNRNAEKSLLEISSLQQTLVSHLSVQEEYIGQMVNDASNTETNIGHGNRELKRASERRSAAQAVFWGTVGLCTWLVVWDAVF